MFEDFTNAPETGRDEATLPKTTSGTKPRRTNPATPGASATEVKTSIRTLRSSEIPAQGSGDDAMPGKKPIGEQHHRENPATAGEVGQPAVETQAGRANLNKSGQAGGGRHFARDAHIGTATAQQSAADQRDVDTHPPSVGSEAGAPLEVSEPFQTSAPAKKSRRKAGADTKPPQNPTSFECQPQIPAEGRGQVDEYQETRDTHFPRELIDLRFTNPLVAEIVQMHRMRRRWLKARNALILQGKAFGRAFCNGDKDAGTAAFDRVMKGKTLPGDDDLIDALAPFIAAIEYFDRSITPIEKHLEKLAKKLPIADWVNSVPGLGFGSVAAIVGEAGDLSAYPSVAGVWKRLGLAVIDGDGRQRKVADADRALAHGYNPERRSIVWIMADSMSKTQRTWLDKETGAVRKPAGQYGEILETEKAKALEKGLSKSHAENRGKRHMSKAVLRDMTLAWRGAVSDNRKHTSKQYSTVPAFLEAAE